MHVQFIYVIAFSSFTSTVYDHVVVGGGAAGQSFAKLAEDSSKTKRQWVQKVCFRIIDRALANDGQLVIFPQVG